MHIAANIFAGAMLCANLLLSGAGVASAQDRQVVKIAHGNPLMIAAAQDLYVPLHMGWWRDEGYDVEVIFSQGTSAAVQSMIGGSASIGVMNSTPWIVADAKGLADIRMVAAMHHTLWRIVTMSSSGIKKPEDLKGKTIGIAAAGSGGLMYLNSMLAKAGLDPQRDVRLAVIGFGTQSYEALKNGTVDASLTFMPEIATFIALGNDASYFSDDEWLEFPDYSLVATGDIIKKDPKLVEALARGVAKAAIFAKANPECVAKIFRKHYGAGRALTLAQDTEIARSNSDSNTIAFEKAGGKYRTQVSLEGLDKLQAFLHANGMFPSPVAPEKLMYGDEDFYKRVNNFDQAAIIAQAKECAGY